MSDYTGRHAVSDAPEPQAAPKGLQGWLYREPVRVYAYGVAAAVVALLVYRGVVAAEESLLWLALAQVVLAIPATEAARNRVASPATQDALERQLVDAWEDNPTDPPPWAR